MAQPERGRGPAVVEKGSQPGTVRMRGIDLHGPAAHRPSIPNRGNSARVFGTVRSMRVTDLRTGGESGSRRASARVEWEDGDRPPLDLFFETEPGPWDDFGAEPNAFLLACAFPAMRHRERRIFIEGAVCPVLCEGLASAARVLEGWYGPPRRLPAVEPSRGFAAAVPARPARAGVLFSGGVDSLHLIRSNRRTFPAGHPLSFSDAVWVTAWDAPERGTAALRREVSRPLAETGIALSHLSSNLRLLDMDLEFFAREYLSAAFLSGGHLLRRLSSLSIASTAPADRAAPWGSHPRLDPWFGSAALSVRHEEGGVARLEKMRSVARWPTAIETLHVCNDEPEGDRLNCGRCEKCVESMTELIAVGRAGPWPTFPDVDVTAEAILSLPVFQDVASAWQTLPDPLREAGRDDLSRAVVEKLREREAARRWHENRNWSGWLRRADRRWLGGRLARAYRRARPGSGRGERAPRYAPGSSADGP